MFSSVFSSVVSSVVSSVFSAAVVDRKTTRAAGSAAARVFYPFVSSFHGPDPSQTMYGGFSIHFAVFSVQCYRGQLVSLKQS